MRPKIGVLARTKSKYNDPDVVLGSVDGDLHYENNPRIPLGSHVFVIKTFKDPDGNRFPVVSCEHGVGWLYWDELELVNELQAG